MAQTIYEIAKAVQVAGEGGKVTPHSPSVVQDLKPKPFDVRPGIRKLTPEQMLSVEVPIVNRENGVFRGFQRDFSAPHSRRMARAMLAGKKFPEPQLSVIEDGRVVCHDGQHTLVAAIILGEPLRVIVTKRTEDEARQLFSDQDKGKKVDPSVLVLAGDDPISEYVQDAITSDGSVWSPLVGTSGRHGRITPYQMYQLVLNYDRNTMGRTRGFSKDSSFDTELGEEMGHLLEVFGTKVTNPLAFNAKGLGAIGSTAVLVIRRTGRHRQDIERWERWMPPFSFAQYQHLRREVELTDALVSHWNKRLTGTRRVRRES